MKKIIFKKTNHKLSLSLLELEKSITYPFGQSDRFSISHGSNYFRFFYRLGTPYWAAIIDSDQTIYAHLCGVLRKVPNSISNKLQKAWYLCDLKKAKQWNHTKTLSTLFRTIFRLIWKCQRGYAISMNPPQGPNPFNILVKKSIFLPLLSSTELSIFSCSYEELQKALPIIEAHRGPVNYVSLEGIKDIIMQKQGKLPLIHLQFGPLKEESLLRPLPGHTYMWCSPSSDSLTQDLFKANYHPSATATIISFRMRNNDWSWVLTSDI